MPPKLFSRRKAESRDLTRESLPSVMLPDPASPDAPGVRQSVAIADVFACVRVLVEGAQMAPLRTYRRTGKVSEQVTDGDAVALLEQPMPGVTQPSFVGHMVATLALWGELFIGKLFNPDGSLWQLMVLPPDRVEVELVAGEPRYKYHRPNAPPDENLTRDDVIHVRSGFTLDGIRGVSPIRQCREAVSLSKSLTDSAAALHANGATPTGLLQVPQGAGGDDQAQALADGWNARHRGPKNRGRIAVVTGEVNWTSVSMSLADAEWVETRKLSKAEICALMGVPPWMVAASIPDASMTYSSVAQEADHFSRFSLAPKLRLIEAALSIDPDLFDPETYCRFDLDSALLRADAQSRFGVYETAIRSGVMRPNEAREIEDLPPLPTEEG